MEIMENQRQNYDNKNMFILLAISRMRMPHGSIIVYFANCIALDYF